MKYYGKQIDARYYSFPVTQYLSTEWVDYVEKPMKYPALRPHFFSMGGWLEGSRGGSVGGWWCGGCVVVVG